MSLINIFALDLDLKHKNYITEPVVTSNDAVRFVVNVTDDGLPVDLSTLSSCTLAHTRSDGVIVVKAGEKTGVNQVSFDLGTTEISVPGRIDAKVQLYEVGGRVSTLDFGYVVTKDPSGNNYIPSEDEQTLIQQVLGDGPQILADAQTATDSANNAATNANTTNSNVQNAEDARVTAENTRESNETSRVTAETNRVSVENTRVTAEDGRVSAESARTTSESTREANETARETAETSRADAESARVTAENTRETNETSRKTSEASRVDAENSRVAAETSRETAETSRVNAESDRVTAENTRETNETSRVNAESDRVTAENARSTAETSRASSEDSRVTAETNRENSEDARVSAEDTRQSQETARQTNTTNAINNLNTSVSNVIHKGVYDPATAYVINNSVSYNGSTYRAIQNTTGNLPTNTTYWTLEARAGVDGTGTVNGISSTNGDIVVGGTITDPTLTLNSSSTSTPNKVVVRDSNGRAQVSAPAVAADIARKDTVDAVQTNLDTHVADTVKHVTQGDKDYWNNKAEVSYVDDQISSVSASGIPKLQMYPYTVNATTDGQTKFDIPMDSFDSTTDTLLVYKNTTFVANTKYAITNTVRNGDGSVATRGFITLATGVSNGTEINMVVLKNVPIGADGAINGSVLAVNTVPSNRVQGLDPLVGQSTDSPKVSVNLSNGVQVVNNTNRQSVLKGLNVKGKALLNLLGQDGNCDNVNKWTPITATATLDTANKVYGSNGIKITLSSTNGYIYQGVPVKNGKYYIALADVKNGNATNVGISFSGDGSLVTSTTAFSTSYKKFLATSDTTLNVIIFANGANTQYAYVDGVRVYEITQAEYNALTTMTPEQVATKYPYTEGIQGTWNPYVMKYGENLLADFSQWFYLRNGKVIKPYELNLTAVVSDEWMDSGQIPAIPNTTYTLSMSHNSKMLLRFQDANGVTVGTDAYTTAQTYTATAPANAKYLRIYLSNDTAGTFTFTNPMLNIGTTALPFEPRVDELLAVQDTFYANPVDGTYPDELNDVGGKLIKTQKWHGLHLTGDLPKWQFINDGAGFKNIALDAGNGVISPRSDEWMATKYNGKPLKNYVNAYDSADIVWVDPTSGYVGITIADVDSGWGEGYTPTSDEIRAYIYGWKMYPSTSVQGEGEYSSGTKYWGYRQNGTTIPVAGGTTTLPTSPAPGFTPYKLLYRLATPVTYEVASEGSVTIHEGGNQMETGVGLVVRERAPIQLNVNYYINGTGVGYRLSKRVNNISAIYRNSLLDKQWTIIQSITSDIPMIGNQYGFIPSSQYDPSVSYTVTYTALDLYKLSAPLTELSTSYSPNDKTRLDDVVEKTNRNEAMVRTLLNVKAEKNQPQLITPTLLNTWTQFPDYDPVGYYKDAEGYVHVKGMMTGSATATDIFRLPKGYRPSKSNIYVVAANNSTTDGTAHIIIDNTGIVRHRSGYYGWVSFGEIIFKAEQ